jgi:23S rRNA-intervening sequence protein
VKFLNIARGSASEVAYLVDLCFELGYLVKTVHRDVSGRCDSLIPQLEALIRKMEILLAEEVKTRLQERETAKKKKRLARETRD